MLSYVEFKFELNSWYLLLDPVLTPECDTTVMLLRRHRNISEMLTERRCCDISETRWCDVAPTIARRATIAWASLPLGRKLPRAQIDALCVLSRDNWSGVKSGAPGPIFACEIWTALAKSGPGIQSLQR